MSSFTKLITVYINIRYIAEVISELDERAHKRSRLSANFTLCYCENIQIKFNTKLVIRHLWGFFPLSKMADCQTLKINNCSRCSWTSIIESYPLWKTCGSDLMTSLINIQYITRLTSSQDLHYSVTRWIKRSMPVSFRIMLMTGPRRPDHRSFTWRPVIQDLTDPLNLAPFSCKSWYYSPPGFFDCFTDHLNKRAGWKSVSRVCNRCLVVYLLSLWLI